MGMEFYPALAVQNMAPINVISRNFVTMRPVSWSFN